MGTIVRSKPFHRKDAKNRKGEPVSSTPQFKKIWEANPLSKEVVDAAIRVHTKLGPGLLESAYEGCLAQELRIRGLHVQSQLALPVFYEGVKIDVRLSNRPDGRRLDCYRS
jgi:hypothetical protein